MRAWLPERQVYGPEPAGERDTDALNRVFADAFTDRYRRDGLVGVRVPHLNPQVWRYALLDAGAGAMLWRDEAGHVVAFNIAHRSGREGGMGPLAVRPARQGAGLRKTILATAVARGYDSTREVLLTAELGLGDTSLVDGDDGLDALVLWHTAPLAEGRPKDEVRVLKLAARDARAFDAAIAATEAAAARVGIRRVALRCQTRSEDAFRRLVARGYRVRWTDLRMTYEGYSEPHPDGGVLFSNWEI